MRPKSIIYDFKKGLTDMTLDDIKYQVAIANRILPELGLASGMSVSVGHASMRVPDAPDRFVIKGRGYEMDALPRMRPQDMVVCDMEGFKVDGPPGTSQCYEVKMHSCMYRDHPEVQSVVHVHPRHTILMSVLGKTLRPMSNSGAHLVRYGIPVYPHSKLILTDKDGTEVAALLDTGKAVMLKGHGAVTVGAGLRESVTNMVHLEEQALLNMHAYSLMGADHPYMSDEMLDEARAQPSYEQVAHFRDTYDPSLALPNGFWAYYTELAADSLKRELD
jgi:L-fuculose-phosphate aldolase